MAFYIFDLDGTLADCEHRRGLLPKWDDFFDACHADTVIEPVYGLLKILLEQRTPRRQICDSVVGGEMVHRVEIWSGRSARVEHMTRVWLANAGIPPTVLTRMRPEGDDTPDQDLKRMWLHQEIAAGTPPTLVFDDRDKVVKMWRAEGIPCLQVAPGDF